MNILNKLLERPNLGSTLKYVERTAIRDYVDGKANDTITGYRYICVAPALSYAQVAIKIMGDAQLDTPEEPYDVIVTGLVATAYTGQSGRPEVSFKASTIAKVK